MHDVNRRQFVALGMASAGVFALGSSDAAETPDKQTASTRPSKNAAKISWRIHQPNWLADQSFTQVTSLLSKHRDVVDEVCLMESAGMSFFPASEFWNRTAAAMKGRLDALRHAGVPSVGINVLITLGHGGDNSATTLPLPAMIGHDGAESDATPCPSRPEFHEYTRAKYAAFAGIGPDFIWVDDDLRMQNHANIVWGCFCPVCLQIFGQEVGRSFSREELVGALNESRGGDLRRAWIEHNAATIEKICHTIGGAIRSVDPEIKTGLMTIGMVFSNYAGSAYDRWFAALRATKGRPGHGFYWDTSVGKLGMSALPGNRMELLYKAAEVERQIASFPATANDLQYEYETWPDGELVKSPQTALNEFAVALISGGCNGMALDTLGWGAPFTGYEPLFARLQHARPYLDTIMRHAKGVPAAGMWAAWSPQIMAKRSVQAGEAWLAPSATPEAPYDQELSVVLSSLGIPLTARPGQTSTVLTGRIAEALTDDELRSTLSGGVLMDTLALRVLEERGLGEFTGVRIAASYPIKTVVGMTMARMTTDPLNGAFAGSLHNTSAMTPAAFAAADVLAPLAGGVRILEQLEDPVGNFEDGVGQQRGPCVTAFENTLGGRVVVAGHAPWWLIHSNAKRHQMLEIADWLSHGKIPVRIVEPLPITPYVRTNAAAAKGIVLLFNTGLESIDTATVQIRLPQDTTVRLVSVDKGPALKRFSGASGWGVRVHNLPAWSTVSLLLG